MSFSEHWGRKNQVWKEHLPAIVTIRTFFGKGMVWLSAVKSSLKGCHQPNVYCAPLARLDFNFAPNTAQR
jgi:hypothetical protein